MLITFKSPASSDVIMFGHVAEQMMKIIGKDIADKGIVTVEYLPVAIEKLKAAIQADIQVEKQSEPNGDEGKSAGMRQRAPPLVELLEWSLKQKVPVVWGV